LFAQEGASVLLADININAAEKGASLITKRFPNIKAIAIKTDVGKEADVKAAVEKAVEEFGRLDVMVSKMVALINTFVGLRTTNIRSLITPVNQVSHSWLMETCLHGVLLLGIMHPEDDNALNTEERIWDLTMQINLKGVWWGCKYAIAAMRQNPVDEAKGLHTGGSIINTASFVAIVGAAAPQLACTYLECHALYLIS
jgi:NAD(P)-dependent dehydrogenase (short-subunit alcohol dehydrogenase family)